MSARVSIADRRTRVALQVPVESPDGFGGVRRSWSTRGMLWASFEPLRASEPGSPAAPGQLVTHRVTLRWQSGIDASMRLLRGTRLFAIRTVYDPQERQRDLVCLCEEVKP